MSTKPVRLDKELIDTLAEKRIGFETPNECLKRLLGGQCSKVSQTKSEVEDSNENPEPFFPYPNYPEPTSPNPYDDLDDIEGED